EAFEDYVLNGMRYSRIEQSLLSRRLPKRIIDDLLEDLSYQITATLHKNKPRQNDELYRLYLKQGGSDSETDFRLKWESGEIDTGNVREMREFKSKLQELAG
ncbi:MAG: hypothetical protein QF551_01425, partial [Candidatus Marinimicrobia bacterium]|nr:hypothetical protein [Candidatus Neomarinimicrobiota bacterium]